MDNTFQNLEKNRVPHGILIDFGMEFAHLPAYNGTLTDSTYINKRVLKEIYNTLLMSRVTTTSSGFVTSEGFDINWKTNRSKNYIALSGLFFKYSRFDANAYPSKIQFANNQFSDKYVGGTWQDPYETLQIFAITTPIEVFDGLNFNIKVPQSIFFSNASTSINRLEIDFADGNGYQQVNFNQEVAVSYTSAGNKIWNYKLVLTNGQLLYAHSKIKITGDSVSQGNNILAKSPTQKGVASWVCDGSGRYQLEAEAEIAYLGIEGTANITLDDAGNDCKITRPLIVVEGFDAGGLLNPETPLGTSNIRTFSRGIEESQSNTLRNLLTGLTEATPSDQDYDIIYIDWDNGVDYLQRNAYVLEEVINWVNDNKVPDANGVRQPNIVLGQSMGGVVARYALSDMETRGEIHETGLFISQDAPQQGANVPLSYQFLYRHLIRQYVTASNTLLGGIVTVPLTNSLSDASISDYLSILDTPASRQLLKNWSTNTYQVNNTFHDDFYSELRGLNNNSGYPQQGNIRNIALSNGSECGTPQTYNAGDHLANVQMNEKLSFLENLAFTFLGPLIGVTAGLTIDPDFFRVGLLSKVPGSSRFIIDVQAKALSYTNNAHIYKGLIRYKKKILGIFDSQVSITNVNKNQPNNILPLDYYGGGFFDTSGQSQIIDAGIADITVEVEDKFGFIPTASALDIKLISSNLDDVDYLKGYVGGIPTPTSPFDNFSTEFTTPNDIDNNNEQHLEFNRRNGNWLAEELEGINAVSDCSAFCSTNSVIINGSDSICSSGTYTLDNDNYSPIWSIISGQSLVSSSINGNSITITKLNINTTGTITLRAFISSGNECSNQTTTVTKNVFLNAKPIISFDNTALRDAILAGSTLADESPFEIESGDIINITTAGSTTDLKWKYTGLQPYGSCLTFPDITTPNSVVGIVPLIGYSFITPDPFAVPLSSSPEISIASSSAGYLEVEATAVNECGCHTETNVYVKEDNSTLPPPPNNTPVDFTASPNPYTTFDFGLIINVFRTPSIPSGQPMPVNNCTFKILNLVTGFSYHQTSFLFNQNEISLFTLPTLPPGTHVMNLSYGGQTVSKLLIVN
tara:strand:- start:2574 stop:5831 length:3258 start_codon:yes stop_codon:yes gene_type:complete